MTLQEYHDVSLVVVPVAGDGSCFFHSLFLALEGVNYIQRNYRQNYQRILNFRNNITHNMDLSELSGGEYIDNMKEYVKIFFEKPETIEDDELEKHATNYVKLTLKNPRKYVGIEHLEYLSRRLKLDFYILTTVNDRLVKYQMGDAENVIATGHQISVIFHFSPQEEHFELIGFLSSNNQVQTCFFCNHPLIEFIRNNKV